MGDVIISVQFKKMEPVIRCLSQWRSFTTKPDDLSWSLEPLWKWMETISSTNLSFDLCMDILVYLYSVLVICVHVCVCVLVYMSVSLCHSPCVEVRGQLAGVGSVLLLCGFDNQVLRLGGRHLYLLNSTNVRADGSRKESEREKAWQSRGWAHPW